jgi:hypothetical protein
MMHGLECYHRSDEDMRNVAYHPPFFKLSLGPMAFDPESNKLKGMPLQELRVNDMPPLNLGRKKPITCTTDDSESVIFYCGGDSFVEGDRFEEASSNSGWVSDDHVDLSDSTTTAFFDTRTRIWRMAPAMPFARSGGAAVRVCQRVYVVGGLNSNELRITEADLNHNSPSKFVLVFDLDEERWVHDHGIQKYTGRYDKCDAACSAKNGVDIIIVSGHFVFTLNTISGEWRGLPTLPMRVGAVFVLHLVRDPSLPHPFLVAFAKSSWATLILDSSREMIYDDDNDEEEEDDEEVQEWKWEMEPDLSNYNLKVARFSRDKVKIFSGNSWAWVDSDDVDKRLFALGFLTRGLLTSSLTEYSAR